MLSKPSCEDGDRDGGVAADAMEKEEFHRDPMTEVIGAVGPFQIVWHVVLGLSIVIHAWQMFANKWLTYKVREGGTPQSYPLNVSPDNGSIRLLVQFLLDKTVKQI